MAIPLTESLINLSSAARLLKSDPSTVFRWCSRGVNRRGTKIVLGAIRVGTRWFTSREAIDKFLADINDDQSPISTEPTQAPKSPRKQSTVDEDANELVRMGA